MPDPQFDSRDGLTAVVTLAVREELERFEIQLAEWLASPEGRFAQYYAERERRLLVA